MATNPREGQASANMEAVGKFHAARFFIAAELSRVALNNFCINFSLPFVFVRSTLCNVFFIQIRIHLIFISLRSLLLTSDLPPRLISITAG